MFPQEFLKNELTTQQTRGAMQSSESRRIDLNNLTEMIEEEEKEEGNLNAPWDDSLQEMSSSYHGNAHFSTNIQEFENQFQEWTSKIENTNYQDFKKEEQQTSSINSWHQNGGEWIYDCVLFVADRYAGSDGDDELDYQNAVCFSMPNSSRIDALHEMELEEDQERISNSLEDQEDHRYDGNKSELLLLNEHNELIQSDLWLEFEEHDTKIKIGDCDYVSDVNAQWWNTSEQQVTDTYKKMKGSGNDSNYCEKLKMKQKKRRSISYDFLIEQDQFLPQKKQFLSDRNTTLLSQRIVSDNNIGQTLSQSDPPFVTRINEFTHELLESTQIFETQMLDTLKSSLPNITNEFGKNNFNQNLQRKGDDTSTIDNYFNSTVLVNFDQKDINSSLDIHGTKIMCHNPQQNNLFDNREGQ